MTEIINHRPQKLDKLGVKNRNKENSMCSTSYLLITSDKRESLKADREKKGKIMDPRSKIRTDFSQKLCRRKESGATL